MTTPLHVGWMPVQHDSPRSDHAGFARGFGVWRSYRRSILPTLDLGNGSVRNSTILGTL